MRTLGKGLFVVGLLLLGGEVARADDGHQRAGWPSWVGCWARPSDTGRYIGYQVGGGSPCRGDAPCADEGTWGWDFQGGCFKRKVVLWWNHGRRYQGGTGAYKIDGPHLLKKEKE